MLNDKDSGRSGGWKGNTSNGESNRQGGGDWSTSKNHVEPKSTDGWGSNTQGGDDGWGAISGETAVNKNNGNDLWGSNQTATENKAGWAAEGNAGANDAWEGSWDFSKEGAGGSKQQDSGQTSNKWGNDKEKESRYEKSNVGKFDSRNGGQRKSGSNDRKQQGGWGDNAKNDAWEATGWGGDRRPDPRDRSRDQRGENGRSSSSHRGGNGFQQRNNGGEGGGRGSHSRSASRNNPRPDAWGGSNEANPSSANKSVWEDSWEEPTSSIQKQKTIQSAPNKEDTFNWGDSTTTSKMDVQNEGGWGVSESNNKQPEARNDEWGGWGFEESKTQQVDPKPQKEKAGGDSDDPWGSTFPEAKTNEDAQQNGKKSWDSSNQTTRNDSWGGRNASKAGESNSWGNKPRGGDSSKGSGCFNCGEQGHRSNECPQPKKPRGGGGGGGACFNCGESGHRSSECPQPKKPRGGGGGECFNCGEQGHRSNECPQPKKPRAGGGGGGLTCFNCGEAGHRSNECTQPKKPRAGGGGGNCFKCGESGHFSRECPNPNANDNSRRPKRERSRSAEKRRGSWGSNVQKESQNQSNGGWAKSDSAWGDDAKKSEDNKGNATASNNDEWGGWEDKPKIDGGNGNKGMENADGWDVPNSQPASKQSNNVETWGTDDWNAQPTSTNQNGDGGW